MQFSLIVLLTSTLTVLASPMPFANPDSDVAPSNEPLPSNYLDSIAPYNMTSEIEDLSLEKRGTTCKIVYRFWPDKIGQCINTNKADCRYGKLYPGHCKGGNHIICCIQ